MARMNWRTMMRLLPAGWTLPHNPHNTQNRAAWSSCAHSADSAEEAVIETRPLGSRPPMQADAGAPTPLSSLTPPLQPGWRIVYRNDHWQLAGGCDDPDHGTVQSCQWDGVTGIVTLTDGQTIPLSRVRSVGAVDYKGRLYGAWTVSAHGYDGNSSSETEGKEKGDAHDI